MRYACRTSLCVVLWLAGWVGVGAQDKTFEDSVELQPGSRLALEADRGSVRLTSWDQPRVDIRARIEPPRGVDSDYARSAVEGTTIEVRGSRRSVRIRTNYRGVPRRVGGFRMPRVHYEIRAPRQLDLDLEIDRSNTVLAGFDGRLLLAFDRSDIEATDLTGALTLTLERGALRATDLSGSTVLDIDRGRGVEVDGVQGSFQLDLDRTDATLRNVQIADDSAVEIDRGDLVLELASDQVLTIHADLTRRADFSSDLPVKLQQDGRELHGTINGGGPTLRIDADRSNVRLRTN